MLLNRRCESTELHHCMSSRGSVSSHPTDPSGAIRVGEGARVPGGAGLTWKTSPAATAREDKARSPHGAPRRFLQPAIAAGPAGCRAMPQHRLHSPAFHRLPLPPQDCPGKRVVEPRRALCVFVHLRCGFLEPGSARQTNLERVKPDTSRARPPSDPRATADGMFRRTISASCRQCRAGAGLNPTPPTSREREPHACLVMSAAIPFRNATGSGLPFSRRARR